MPVNVDSLRLELVTSELQSTTGLENAGDGSGRLFALQQEGAIWIIEGGAVQQAPFLDLRDQVGSQSSEQGLLGLAFHPRYAENGYFYVNYTDLNGDTVIARYQVSSDPSQADPGSELVLMHIDQPFANHNGGGMVFGPDGYLYISLGDGGSAGDPQGNAQSLDTPQGK
ncbi:MAG: glucose dehydrogenase, partial [Chloroflexota bacterium]